MRRPTGLVLGQIAAGCVQIFKYSPQMVWWPELLKKRVVLSVSSVSSVVKSRRTGLLINFLVQTLPSYLPAQSPQCHLAPSKP